MSGRVTANRHRADGLDLTRRPPLAKPIARRLPVCVLPSGAHRNPPPGGAQERWIDPSAQLSRRDSSSHSNPASNAIIQNFPRFQKQFQKDRPPLRPCIESFHGVGKRAGRDLDACSAKCANRTIRVKISGNENLSAFHPAKSGGRQDRILPGRLRSIFEQDFICRHTRRDEKIAHGFRNPAPPGNNNGLESAIPPSQHAIETTPVCRLPHDAPCGTIGAEQDENIAFRLGPRTGKALGVPADYRRCRHQNHQEPQHCGKTTDDSDHSQQHDVMLPVPRKGAPWRSIWLGHVTIRHPGTLEQRSSAAVVSRWRKIFLCGNGGSAADAQHIAAEFVSVLSQAFHRPG